MIQAMLFAHLLGDYVLQNDALVRWKARSVLGLLAHGALVTLCTWLCSLPFSIAWWPYALAIGATHTVIDAIRTGLGRMGSAATLLIFLVDQLAHGSILLAAVYRSGWLGGRPAGTALGTWLQGGHRLWFVVGYTALSMPSWVIVHFVVDGMGAVSRSLPGRPGERYLAMIERGLIATFVLVGQYLLIPLVVAPRLVFDGVRMHLEGEQIGYLGELLLSVSLAVGVGMVLKELAYPG
jgi:hypothetical protein